MGRVSTGILGLSCLALAGSAVCATVSPLFSRGYTVIPEPQSVTFSGGDFQIDSGWSVQMNSAVPRNDVAVETLREELQSRYGLRLDGNGSKIVRLAVVPGSVSVGTAADRDRAALAEQAYALDLSAERIQIQANAPTGLFYGVETLAQMIKPRGGALWLPTAHIADWPDLELRQIYWDDAHHLERLDELKRAIRQAAFFKANGFALKLEGHFQFKSAPALVEPQALSPEQLQELTDYGLRYHIQLIPYLDGPAHIAFILKHPEYAKLRAFPNSNYELCTTNPDSYKLLNGMFQDLLDATKGSKYFYLSTDEPYYVGMANNAQCQEAARTKELGSVGKVLAEFVTKTAGYLHDRGRTVVFWGESPLKTGDIPSLPSYMVNGEVYGPAFDQAFRKHGIREMIYTSSEGEEKMFPDYFVLPQDRLLRPERGKAPRVMETFRKISFDSSRKNADLMGMLNAGWADMGLHPETFWLGYATAVGTGWRPGSPDPRESMSTFYPIFYGPEVSAMDRVYQLMSYQAQWWSDSWDRVDSKWRKPIWGYSAGIYNPPRPAHDQSLPLPPVPSADNLSFSSHWEQDNARRLQLTGQALPENDELLGLLRANLERARFNRYNLEVYVAIAGLYRQNLEMLSGLGRINKMLEQARGAAAENQPARAVASIDRALSEAERIRRQRNAALREATGTWYKSWLPRVAQANGRTFLHELDDVKDHLPDRTVDMSYLVYRELNLPLGEWAAKVQDARNRYAAAHQLPARNGSLDWKKLED